MSCSAALHSPFLGQHCCLPREEPLLSAVRSMPTTSLVRLTKPLDRVCCAHAEATRNRRTVGCAPLPNVLLGSQCSGTPATCTSPIAAPARSTRVTRFCPEACS